MTLKELSQELSRHAERICWSLLPNGKKEYKKFVSGGVDGSEGRSLQVDTEGDRQGMWYDHNPAAPQTSGDLIDLYMLVKNVSKHDAALELKAFCGIVDDETFTPMVKPSPEKQAAKSAALGSITIKTKTSKMAADGACMKYLTETRGIRQEVVEAFKLEEVKDLWGGSISGMSIVFPFYNEDGKIKQYQKYRGLSDKDGSKQIRAEKGLIPVLFGKHLVPSSARTLIICEGEIDAMTWKDYGFNAASVPLGAGNGAKLAWIDNDWEWLGGFDEIYLNYDSDEAGQKSVEDCMKRLGTDRCKIVKLPNKDINECLQNKISKETLEKILKSAKTTKVFKEMLSFHDLKAAAREAFFPTQNGIEKFIQTPFKFFNENWQIKKKEVVVWTGKTGGGKSTFLSYITSLVAVGAFATGKKIALFTFEMGEEDIPFKVIRQLLGRNPIDEEELDKMMDWVGENIVMYNSQGLASLDAVIKQSEYCIKSLGCEHIIIDNLSALDVSEEKLDDQKRAINKIADLARKFDVICHLVTHMRKGSSSQYKEADIEDITTDEIRGNGQIGNRIDYVFVVWKNVRKRQAIDDYEFDGTLPKGVTDIKYIKEQADVKLKCAKQRRGGRTYTLRLWFDTNTEQYHDLLNWEPKNWVERTSKAQTEASMSDEEKTVQRANIEAEKNKPYVMPDNSDKRTPEQKAADDAFFDEKLNEEKNKNIVTQKVVCGAECDKQCQHSKEDRCTHETGGEFIFERCTAADTGNVFLRFKTCKNLELNNENI